MCEGSLESCTCRWNKGYTTTGRDRQLAELPFIVFSNQKVIQTNKVLNENLLVKRVYPVHGEQ